MLEIFTIQMAKWRSLNDTDIKLVDTTIKSAKPIIKQLFAPNDFKMVLDSKAGHLSNEDYTKKYLGKLEQVYKDTPNLVDGFLSLNEKVALACYCMEGKFCHRHLLADWLVEKAKVKGIEVKFYGEFRKERYDVNSGSGIKNIESDSG